MHSINPYISFDGNTREAMNFYKDIFGGELELNEVDGSPMEQHWPDGKGKIFHSALSAEGKLLLMGTDMTGPIAQVIGNNIQLAINCSSEEEIRTLTDKLAAGGEMIAPVSEQFWGALFGAARDKFGISWMLNYDKA